MDAHQNTQKDKIDVLIDKFSTAWPQVWILTLTCAVAAGLIVQTVGGTVWHVLFIGFGVFVFLGWLNLLTYALVHLVGALLISAARR